MKKRYLFTLLLFVFFTGISNAQTRLLYGKPASKTMVDMPYYSWDLLRTLNTGWLREYRPGALGAWRNFTNIINKKDADGRFTHLEYLLWDPANSVWQIDNSYKYTYTTDAGKVTEQYADMQDDFGASKRREMYDYDGNGRCIKTTHEIEDGGLYTPYFADYHKYNSAGLRIKDSSVSINQSGMESPGYVTVYEYDGSNRCVKESSVWRTPSNSWDTVGYSLYLWNSSSQLTKTINYSMPGMGLPIEPYNQFDFTYAGNKVDEVIYFQYDTGSKTMEPNGLNKQHYDGQGRLTAIVEKARNGSAWSNADSVALNYLPNGLFDTSYQFIPQGQGWQSYANYRFIFHKVNTSIRESKEINSLKLYPNPAIDKVTVEFDALKNGLLQLHLTDLTGKRLQTIETFVVAGPNTVEVTLHDIAAGIYFLTAGNSTLKIIKE